MRRYLEDRRELNLPAHQLAETTYERITADPVGEIGRLYDQLGIGGKAKGLDTIAAYAGTLKGYRRNVHRIEPEHAAAIRERWAFAFAEWGYDPGPPDEIEVAEAGETH
jgi:hypothetical protein